MHSFFARDRFGRPQLIAIAFLLAFMAQCLWWMVRLPLTPQESAHIAAGSALWSGLGTNFASSRLVALAAAAGATVGSAVDVLAGTGQSFARWGARLPFLGVALLLGGSLWYVARRLCGNTGGYVGLALYCFTPSFVWRGALVNADIVAAWGIFGVVFAAIAGAHTLYAPLTWKQRAPRTALLGTAIGLALAASSYAVLVLPLALLFMLYLVPGKRKAALGVFGAALAIGVALLLIVNSLDVVVVSFHLGGFRLLFDACDRASASMFTDWIPVPQLSPALALLGAIAIAAYALWRRARYFGNTAPLLAALVMSVTGLAVARPGMFPEMLPALPFLFVFIAGIFADLLETRWRNITLGVLVPLLTWHGAYALLGWV